MSLGKDSPDTDGINQAAVNNAAVSKEALDWWKTQYADQADERQAASDMATKTATLQNDISKQNADISKDYYDYQTGTFRPLEKSLVADAQGYDTPDRRESEAAQSITDVGTQFDAARRNMASVAADSGVSPSSGAFMGQMRALAAQEGASKASAANLARKGVETTGWAKKMDASSLGRNLPSSQTTAANTAVSAGSAATNSAQVPVTVGNQSTALMGQGYSQAIAGNQSAGNLYGQVAQINSGDGGNAAGYAAGIGGIAQGIGSAGGVSKFFSSSSKKLKTNKKKLPADFAREAADEALEGINNLDVESWRYKKGVADEGEHIGPYAEDVQREFGDGVAPGGKMIDMNANASKNLEAIEALKAQLAELKEELAELS